MQLPTAVPFRLIETRVSKQQIIVLTSISNFFCTQSTYTNWFPTKYIHLSLICTLVHYVHSETKNNPVEFTDDSIRTVRFAKTNDLKILVHGVKGSKDDDFNTLLRAGKYDRKDEQNEREYSLKIKKINMVEWNFYVLAWNLIDFPVLNIGGRWI